MDRDMGKGSTEVFIFSEMSTLRNGNISVKKKKKTPENCI